MTEHTEAAQQQAELDQLEYTISEDAYQQVGAGLPEQQNDSEENQQLLKALFDGGFAVLAPGWGVTETETETLSKAYAPLMDKYMPDGMGAYSLEINAALITFGFYMAHKDQPRKVEQQEGGEDATQAE